MAVLFSDSFDMYATPSDMVLGRWTSLNSFIIIGSGSTAFGVGQGISSAGSGNCLGVFITGSNETTIYFSIRLKYNSSGSSSGANIILTLKDVANSQMAISWNGDGSITLFSGSSTVLGNFPGMFVLDVWDSWQGQVVINNTTGSITIRKNGSGTNAISLTNVNTRAGSTNNYVNQFTLSSGALSSFFIDDLWLNNTSGAAPTGWPGDIRLIQVIPNATVQEQFTAGGASTPNNTTGTSSAWAIPANQLWAISLTVVYAGSPGTSLILSMNAGYTGNLKVAFYDNTGSSGTPGNLIATSTALVNPVTGVNTITLPSGINFTKGQIVFMTLLSDTAFNININTQLSNVNRYTITQTYSSGFPTPFPTSGFAVNGSGLPYFAFPSWIVNNFGMVNQLVEDGDTTYVASSTVGQEDIYSVGSLPVTVSSVVGVNAYVMWRKTDSGTRTSTLSLSANGSADTAQVSNFALSTSYIYSQSGMTSTDPTGVPWTVTTVNGINIGITLAS